MQHNAYKAIAPKLPQQPGVYKYFDAENNLLYVGKAKNLKKRVSSYFTKTYAGYKTHELVQRIHKIEFTIVDSEQDAFLLENALIKQFQPKFNIDLKDDKSYPYIVIKKEPFPRVFFTRRKINDGSLYLGPFTSVTKVRELLDFIKLYIPLRTCKLVLTNANIQKQKFKVCLEYHLGNCKGPCEGLQTAEDYTQGITQIQEILKGNLSTVISSYKEEMKAHAANLDFEKAARVKKKLENLETYQAKSIIVSKHLGNVDVFSISTNNNQAIVNYLMVQNGTIVQTHTIELTTKQNETPKETLAYAVEHLRAKFNSLSNELVVPFLIELEDETILQTIPKAGDKKKLLELSEKNVFYFLHEVKKKQALHIAPKVASDFLPILTNLQRLLKLPQLPVHIECFDNSNFQGSYPVSAMVCFKNGMPSKADYRHFKVKTVTGINDFATMKEVVYRRYKRLQEEQQSLPQLVIIDGGKGQLSSAKESLKELNLQHIITLIGLAKNEEELFFVGDTQSLKLKWDSPELLLIKRIRDEVHRFGITFHRQLRSKGTFTNQLQTIKGIGKNTADQLLKKYKSIGNIKQLSLQELEKEVGKAKASLVVEGLKGE
jgi:excinuclease ABC subunit C